VRQSVAVPFEAEYLLHVPASVDAQTLLVLTLHGYGSNPETMLRLTEMAVGGDAIIAGLRGPNQHYLTALGGPMAGREVGYNWGTVGHAAINIKLHHEMVRAVSEELRGRFEIPIGRTVLMGFSQPVGMNYRYVGTFPEMAGGVVAICGGVPKDWEEDKYGVVECPILHIARAEDEFFPEVVARGFPDRLRAHARSVEFHMLPGGHRFPSKAGPVIREFLKNLKTP
jgi:predicted esterase